MRVTIIIEDDDGSAPAPDTLEQEIHHMAQDLEDLKAEVAQTLSVEQSAIALIQGLEDRLSSIIPAGGEGTVDAAEIAALRDQLATGRAALAAAITENTPSEETASDTTADAGADAGGGDATATDTSGGGEGADTTSGDADAPAGEASTDPAPIDPTVDNSANDQVVDDQANGGEPAKA